MELKDYQTRTLAVLRRFFEDARIHGAAAAYRAITDEPEQAKRLHGFGGAYRPPNGMEETPYVCLRLPTGGGKTLLAAHAIAVAKESWIERDWPLMLWLVTSSVIKAQTVDALKNPRHPYRRALDADFAGAVRVFDIADFALLRPQDLRDNLCVVVGTIQSLRVGNTEGRRVYAHNEDVAEHFAGLPKRIAGLESFGAERAARYGTDPDDSIRSFANLLHLHRPLMIVDEAHNVVTGLSREMQGRVNPAAIIEFTATPRANSNNLHAVSALELKAEQMIKLPVVLAEHATWESAVTGALKTRAELAAEAAKARKGYIRPIVLFQAQPKDEDVTVAVLRQHLMEVHGLTKDQIAVATGDQRELDGVDLFRADCPVIAVVTQQALKEGWDCSFAYVFCSVANIRSATDVEQLLGRVLRMPYAERRTSERLNRAYAHLTSRSFSEAAMALRDRLIDMGFEEKEAEENIEPAQGSLGDGLFGRQRRATPVVTLTPRVTSEAGAALVAIAPGKVRVETAPDGTAAVAITGFLGAAKEAVVAQFDAADRNRVREEIARYEAEHVDHASPAELGQPFVVPRLMAWVQGELVFAEPEAMMEGHDWSLRDHPAQLSAGDFSITQVADIFEIDLSGATVTVQHKDQTGQMALDVPVQGWTEASLVRLLERPLRDPGITQSELVAWLSDAVHHLAGPRGIAIAALMECRFLLARKLKERLTDIRKREAATALQLALFAPEARPTVSFDDGFVFREGMFAGVPTFSDSYRFSKHFLGWDRVPAFDGKPDGEEFQCAKLIDAMPQVNFWVRNVSGHADAFRLPVAGGFTYPDFVAKLKDGRIFVVEYKGAMLAGVDDSARKRAIGDVWESASEGRGVYLMAEKVKDGVDTRAQLLAAVG